MPDDTDLASSDYDTVPVPHQPAFDDEEANAWGSLPAPHGVPQLTINAPPHPTPQAPPLQPAPQAAQPQPAAAPRLTQQDVLAATPASAAAQPYDLLPVEDQPDFGDQPVPKEGRTIQPVAVGQDIASMPAKVAQTAGDVTDVSDAVRAARGQMTPEEAQTFALGSVPMLLGGPEAKAGEEAAEAIAPRFYSAVGQAVDNAKTNAAPAQQWLGMIKNTPGVKQEELDWLGVPEWLNSQQGVVPKQALQDYVRQNQVGVQEVEKGQPLLGWQKDALHFYDNLTREEIGNLTDSQRAQYEALKAMDTEQPAKFGQYTLPGAEPGSYRELLLTMPERKTVLNQIDPSWTTRETASGNYQAIGNYNGEKDAILAYGVSPEDALQNAARETTPEPNYKSSHWDEPNVLAHVRFDDRTVNAQPIETIREIGQRMAKAVGAPTAGAMGSGAADRAVQLGAVTPQEAAEFSKAAHWNNQWADKPGLSEKTLHMAEIQSDFGQEFRREKKKISDAVDRDFDTIADKMIKAGVIIKECD